MAWALDVLWGSSPRAGGRLLLALLVAACALAADNRPDWEKNFNELGSCLSIDCASISAQDPAVATTGD